MLSNVDMCTVNNVTQLLYDFATFKMMLAGHIF